MRTLWVAAAAMTAAAAGEMDAACACMTRMRARIKTHRRDGDGVVLDCRVSSQRLPFDVLLLLFKPRFRRTTWAYTC